MLSDRATAMEEGDVRFGSKADICAAQTDVRFTPNSDRKSGHVPMVMSALPLKADMCQTMMSAEGHYRTWPDGRATATYASCGNVNLPPSSIEGVDKAVASEATDEMTFWRSGSVLSFRRIVIGVARS